MSRKFGCNSTGEDVLKDTDLSGKTSVVTGGNAGLGQETVRVLAAAGAHVVFTSRSAERGQQIAKDLEASGVKGSISAQQLDLADLASVRAAAADLQQLPRIDYLILNAGVMGTKHTYTKDGFEMQLGTNHIGHFQLVRSLLPKLQAQSHPSRVVVVSSKGHIVQRRPLQFDDLHYARRRYNGFASYAQSKTCNILFASELARRLQGSRVSAYSLHPGTIGTTSIVRHFAPPGSCFGRVTAFLLGLLPSIGEFKNLKQDCLRQSTAGAVPYEAWSSATLLVLLQGVATTVYAATAPELEGHSGAYLEDCRVKQPSKVARDPQQAQRLWQVTEEQIAAAAAPGGFKP